MDLHNTLPRPGTVWGAYPLKPASDSAPIPRPFALSDFWRSPLAQAHRVVGEAQRAAAQWQRLDAHGRATGLANLRLRLRQDGLTPHTMGQALGVCMVYAQHTLGQTPRDTQCLAAALLLDQRMAEMATGEGKTLALALAAAVGALAAIPVHVLTANDYLAARDCENLLPFYAALGLRCAALLPTSDAMTRKQTYASDVVYATAQGVAFDFLRDQQAFGTRGEHQRLASTTGTAAPDGPMLRGLCMALLDEADSILLDEADIPLVLSQGVSHAGQRAFLWQALALARRLVSHRDFNLSQLERSVSLTADGEAQVATWARELGGPWTRPRYRREALVLALRALHIFQRDTHYLVRESAIHLLDEVTGRVAAGRVWSRGLQSLVAMKEGLTPPADTETVGQTSFQRLFQRYWRLGGISGTLMEARAELREVFGAEVIRVPLHGPNRRQVLPPRQFFSANERWSAVCERASAVLAAGRPVLVGTDSVAESQDLSDVLQARGIPHQVLNALFDVQEASIIAQAGRAGSLTVATRMAGRGTDIALDGPARANGGLHVISCQRNPSHRLDRQLAGRAARQGDPGSVEFWLLETNAVLAGAKNPDNMAPCIAISNFSAMAWWATARQRVAQRREDQRRASLRRLLIQQGRHWEEQLAFAGPAPSPS